MQVQKEEVRASILKNARKEFYSKGFQQASMRKIAKKSSVSVSNIYNYFRSKDDLFSAVVYPVINQIERCFQYMESSDLYKDPEAWSFDYHMHMAEVVATFIEEHRYLLELIAFKSHGSSLHDYKNNLIDRYTAMSLTYLEKSKEVYPSMKSGGVSEFFMHIISSFLFNFLIEILMHNVGREDIIKLSIEMINFSFYGFEGMYGNAFDSMIPKQD